MGVHLAKKHNASVWDLIDELLGFERNTLVKALCTVIAILFIVSCSFIYREISRGETTMALLHGGFLFLLCGLIASIAFVVSEVTSLEAETAVENGEVAAPASVADKKA